MTSSFKQKLARISPQSLKSSRRNIHAHDDDDDDVVIQQAQMEAKQEVLANRRALLAKAKSISGPSVILPTKQFPNCLAIGDSCESWKMGGIDDAIVWVSEKEQECDLLCTSSQLIRSDSQRSIELQQHRNILLEALGDLEQLKVSAGSSAESDELRDQVEDIVDRLKSPSSQITL